jgi:hypothetical protein
MEAYNSNQVAVTPEGLKLTCRYSPKVSSFYGKTQNYLCGAADGPYCCHTYTKEQAGYNAPLITLDGEQTIVFQAVMKLPRNTGEADPAFWMDGPPYSGTEFDYPEFYGNSSQYAKDGYAKTPDYFHWFAGTEPTRWGLPLNPEQGFHTYTTEVSPGAQPGKYAVRVWFDGVLQKLEDGSQGCYSESCAREVSREVSAPSVENKLSLILQYGLREGGGHTSEGVSNEFKTPGEERSLWVRSVAVFEDAAHLGIGVEHGGIALGTTIR